MLKDLTVVITDLGSMVLFSIEITKTWFHSPPRFHNIVDQIWKITVQSISTTALAGFFVGAIMTVQFTMQMNQFGALGYLGGLATSGTIREVGPLLIAFMLSGKIGAFTSAELGTMRVTEQIDAIRCLGANPIQEIILPRYAAIIVSSFFLLGAGLVMSVFGGMLMGMLFSGVTYEEYLRHVPTIVTGFSLFTGLVKCFIFSNVLALICTFKGYTTTGGAKGVGRSVVTTAVATMVGIVVADWFSSFIGDIVMRILQESFI